MNMSYPKLPSYQSSLLFLLAKRERSSEIPQITKLPDCLEFSCEKTGICEISSNGCVSVGSENDIKKLQIELPENYK